MKSLINEIREYLNQDKQINKTCEKFHEKSELYYDIGDFEGLKQEVKRLEKRCDLMDEKIYDFVRGVASIYKITEEYFIGCVNQYTEVLSYGDIK